MESYCLVCDELLHWAHVRAPEQVPSKDRDGASEYILATTPSAMAFVGLGALSPGYILMTPKRHCYNIGELNDGEWTDFKRLKSMVALHLRSVYGSAMFFEHGSSAACATTGACVDHAHLHALPGLSGDVDQSIPSHMKRVLISDLDDLQSFKSDGYLYVENQRGEKVVYQSDQPIPSQLLRRIWAEQLGMPRRYDWGIFWEEANMMKTFQNFVDDTGVNTRVSVSRALD